MPLDITDMAGIDRLGGAISERWGKLDILVANAGDPRRHLADRPYRGKNLREGDDRQRHRDMAADPLGRSAAARLRCRPRRHPDVEPGAFASRAFWAPYAASKAAVEALAALLGARDGEHAAQGQLLRSRRHPHRHARAKPYRVRTR